MPCNVLWVVESCKNNIPAIPTARESESCYPVVSDRKIICWEFIRLICNHVISSCLLFYLSHIFLPSVSWFSLPSCCRSLFHRDSRLAWSSLEQEQYHVCRASLCSPVPGHLCDAVINISSIVLRVPDGLGFVLHSLSKRSLVWHFHASYIWKI
jgi:hypothetical protein